MLHCVEDRLLHFVVLGAFLQRLAVLDADKGAGDHDEAGEQDPGAEGGEEVVRARYGVETEEHVYVARFYEARFRSRVGLVCGA